MGRSESTPISHRAPGLPRHADTLFRAWAAFGRVVDRAASPSPWKVPVAAAAGMLVLGFLTWRAIEPRHVLEFVIFLGMIVVLARVTLDDRRLVALVVGAFLLRALISVLHPVKLGGDEATYYTLGIALRDSWLSGAEPPIGYRHNLFYFVNAVTYHLFGDWVLSVRLLNSFLGAALLVVVYHLGVAAFRSRGVGIAALAVTALHPDLVAISALNQKDALVTLLLAVALLAVARGVDRPRWLVALIPVSVALFDIRAIYVVVLAATVILGLALHAASGDLRPAVRRRLLGAGGVALGALVVAGTLASPVSVVMEFIHTHSENPEVQEKVESSNATLRRFLTGDFESPRDYAVSAARTIVTPMPIYVIFDQTLGSATASVSGVAWYALLPLVAVGIWVSRGNTAAWPLALWIGVTFAVVSHPYVALAGTPLRWRAPVTPFLALFAAQAAISARTSSDTARAIRRVSFAWGGAAALILAAYVLARTEVIFPEG